MLLARRLNNGLCSLDPGRFAQQCAELAGGLQPIDAPHLSREAVIPGAGLVGVKMAAYAVAQGMALADIQQRILLAVKSVDARTFGQIVGQTRRQMRGQGVRAENGVHRGRELRLRQLAAHFAPEIVNHPGIAQCPVPCAAAEAVALHHRIEIVARILGKQPPRELDGAQHLRGEAQAGLEKLTAQERVVETRVVRHEHCAVQLVPDRGRNVGEARRVGHHLVADAREILDVFRDRAFGIHQRTPLLDELAIFQAQNADFGDPVVRRVPARRLQVDECQILRKVLSRGHRAIAGGGTGRGAGRGTPPRTAGSGACAPNRTRRSAPFR